ncbi:MAG: translation initiation factor IF-2 [Phycisphaerales bacterium]|nr:translation initiation factor IF-2 [Phycisphaerales bacterium]
MAAKRISALAKELGVDSKAIVAKCHAEGISPDVVKGHMSTVSAGLEASIRDWFSGGGSTTAVETSQKVDIDQVRKKAPPRRKGTKKGDDDHSEHDALPATEPEAVLIEPPPPAPKPEPIAPAPHTPPAPPAPAHKPEPVAAAPAEPPPAPARATPFAGTPAPEPIKLAPTRAPAPQAPAADSSAVEAKPTRAPEPPRPDQAPPPAARPAAAAPVKPVAPAPMNVPQRPTGVAPAGPRLQAPASVRLSGPKVVRVEAPEQLAAPRPRRYGPSTGAPGGPMGPRVGGGAGGPGAPGTADDDRGRSPRRKQEPAKRSTGQGVPARRRASAGGEDWVGGQVFSEQDLIEREARLARSGGFLKKRKQELTKPGQPAGAADTSGRIRIAAPFTIKDLSETTGVKASEIVKKLFLQGVMKKINDPIAADKAVEIMMDFDIDLEVVEARTAEETVSDQFLTRDMKDARPRGAVVTILGHVDHGKTSLLDKIRNANVAAGEAGGITQKTSAFVAEVVVEGQQRQVVFLDTPGHEAFTSMRARGAKMTDVVVLVVSAPEGVMPQTIESINHAKAAKVPLVVALNKVDRPDATEAQIQKTLGELAKAGINPVEWGGETEVVRVSAVTGQGITQLLETLDYQAQLLDLKADYDGQAQGTVIEAKTEEGRGAVANILVQQGRLKVGDFIVMGRAFGRVRDITDDKGARIKEALPPMPVQVSGIDLVCDAGDKFFVTRSLREAEDAADQRRHRERETQLAQPKLTLDSLFSQMQTTESETKEIRIILKTDQQGTVDVLKSECEKVKSAEVRTRVIHAAVGGIQESDVTLADASKAIVIGFNVIPSGKARALAEHKGVEIRTYQVIYDITDDLKKAAEGMLAPELREDVLGHAEVRAVFRISKVGSVAGCYVTDGTVQRDALIRVTRNGIVIEHDRKLAQLRRVKDDVKEVRAGTECGMKIDGYDDIKEGDVLECYKKIEVKRTL